jgi:hypothetical protein
VEGVAGAIYAGILICFGGLLVFAIVSLVAFGLLIARKTKAARIIFATGLLCPTVATLPLFLFLLSTGDPSGPLVLLVLGDLSILLAGVGQFIASLRSGRAYATALGCALGATAFVAAAWLDRSDPGYQIVGGQIVATRWAWPKLPLEIVGLFLAVASLISVLFFRSGGQKTIHRPQE